MADFQIGDHVSVIYKTGKYLGEITDIRPQHYLVRVLAVAKHPIQGDLHSPKDTKDVFFHERRALAFKEQANIPLKMVKPFTNHIPEYMDSLKIAVENMKQELQEEASEWALKSLLLMESLEKDYFKG